MKVSNKRGIAENNAVRISLNPGILIIIRRDLKPFYVKVILNNEILITIF